MEAQESDKPLRNRGAARWVFSKYAAFHGGSTFWDYNYLNIDVRTPKLLGMATDSKLG